MHSQEHQDLHGLERLRDYETEIERLRKLAYEDELTGLGNRRAFRSILRKSLAQTKRYGTPTCLACVDLDGFKGINDQRGHAAGDETLRRVGAVLQSCVREADHVVRLGGDEFAIILPNTDIEDAVDVAERVRTRVATIAVGDSKRLTASIGLAMARDSEEERELYTRTDQVLYRAKAEGGNCTKIDFSF